MFRTEFDRQTSMEAARREAQAEDRMLEEASKSAARKRQEMMEILRPLLDFRQPVDSAKEDDLRIYWDVRVVRGKDTPYAQVQGVGSLPGAMASNKLSKAPSMIEQEVIEKIAKPMVAAMQKEAEKETSTSLRDIEKSIGSYVRAIREFPICSKSPIGPAAKSENHFR
jgi:hypothetical protein